jgi:hypothetical protein
MMKISNLVVWLSSLIVVLALFAASIGLCWQDGDNSFSFVTLRGDTVSIAGRGLYHYDTTLMAMGFTAGDAVTLILGIPALIFALLRYQRGSVRGGLLLAGTLAYFLYNYGSMAFGAAYNQLFLIYVVLMSASLFGLILTFMSFDLAMLPAHFSPHLPRRNIGIYEIVSGAILLLIWPGLSIIPALVEGKAPPEVWSYTTVITYAIDIGILAPVLITTGVMLLHRKPLGYLLSSTLLVFTVLLGTNLLTAGMIQILTGSIDIKQFIGFVASFAILTLYAIWFTLALFHNVSDRISPQDIHLLDVT